MMGDQAAMLRRCVRPASAAAELPARVAGTILVAGGRGGVGTTTVAWNLAAALVRQGFPAVLVEADPDHAAAALWRDAPARPSLADVLLRGVGVLETLREGPGGIGLVPGDSRLHAALAQSSPHTPCAESDPRSAQPCAESDPRRVSAPSPPARLAQALRTLAETAQFVVIDVGNGTGPLAEALWRTAEHVLVVATPQSDAVAGAYAAVKLLGGGDPALGLHCAINHVRSAREGRDAQERLRRTCRRVLGADLAAAGSIRYHRRLAEQGGRGPLLPARLAGRRPRRQFDRLAAVLAQAVGGAGNPRREAEKS
jgi:MinD-like ATPase involved in chromosome partitioning or flagellar assembly